MIIRSSALKHGINEVDISEAASWPLIAFALDNKDNPQRVMQLGFDTKGRLLEIVILTWDDGTEELIHCMKARPQYINLLP